MKAKDGMVWHVLKNIIVFIGFLAVCMPLFLVFINTFKPLDEAGRNFFALPESFYTGNYMRLIVDNNYWSFALNSLKVTSVALCLVFILIPSLSYAIARNFHKLYYKIIFYSMLMGLFIPGQVVMLPAIKFMSSLKLTNHFGLILLYGTFSITQGMFLCVNYIKTLPVEMEESARIDGCNVFQVYTKIVLALMKPILSTVIVLNALWFWNDFFVPLMMLNRSRDLWTLPLFQFNFKTEYSFDYTMAFTAYLMAMVPILAVYAFLQKYIIKGLTSGAIKG